MHVWCLKTVVKFEFVYIRRHQIHRLRYGSRHDIISIGNQIAGNRLFQLFAGLLSYIYGNNNIFVRLEIFYMASHIFRRLPHGNLHHFTIRHMLFSILSVQ